MGDSVPTRAGVGQCQPCTCAVQTHTRCFLGAFPLSMSTRCSSVPLQVPLKRAEGPWSSTGGSTRSGCCPNRDLSFQFSKRLCFHLKRCCLLLLDLNKVKDNRTQMKYISTLISHSLALLPGAAAGADPVAIRCSPGSE